MNPSNATQMYAFHFTFLPIKPKKFRNQVSPCILIGSSQPRYYTRTLRRGYYRSNYKYLEPMNEWWFQIFTIPFRNGNFWLSTYMSATDWLWGKLSLTWIWKDDVCTSGYNVITPVHVYEVSLCVIHGLFKSMVAAGAMNLSNTIQMYAFHLVFLPIKPSSFREMYNKHPLSIESIPDPWTNDMKNISLAADVLIHWSVKL